MNSPGTKLENNGHFVEIDSDGTIDISGTSLKFNGATLAGGALPMGGTTGEALVKASNADSDAAWTAVTLVRTVTLTDAEIKSLPAGHSTEDGRVEIIPAPGPNKIIVPSLPSAVVGLNLVANYTNVSSLGSLRFVLGGSVDAGEEEIDWVITPVTWGTLADFFAWPGIAWLISPQEITTTMGTGNNNLANKPLKLLIDNAPGNFTGGDPANTLKITIPYSIVSVA